MLADWSWPLLKATKTYQAPLEDSTFTIRELFERAVLTLVSTLYLADNLIIKLFRPSPVIADTAHLLENTILPVECHIHNSLLRNRWLA